MIFYLFLIATVMFSGCSSGGWQLVWQDEFDGNGMLNENEWNYEEGGGGWGNNEEQFYVARRSENCRKENGVLIVECRIENWGNRAFTSARFNTKKSWVYGKLEARMRLPKGRNLWPAFWTLPQNWEYGGWPKSGEIDIMEVRGQEINKLIGTIHLGDPWVYRNGETWTPDLSQDFHVFAVDWNPNEIKWMIDERVYHVENLNRDMNTGGNRIYNHNTAPFDKAFNIKINLAVGGNFFGPGKEYISPDDARREWSKRTLEIDYVRVYQWR